MAVDNAAFEETVPRINESAQHFGLLRSDRLYFRTRCTALHCLLQRLAHIGICELIRIYIADACLTGYLHNWHHIVSAPAPVVYRARAQHVVAPFGLPATS